MAHTAHDKIRYDKRNARTRPRTTYTGCTRGGNKRHTHGGVIFFIYLFHAWFCSTCQIPAVWPIYYYWLTTLT